jgi:hypothetical protein
LVGSEDEGLRARDDRQVWDAGAEWSVAEGDAGELIVYVRHCNDGFAPIMRVCENVEALKEATNEHGGPAVPSNVIRAVAAALDRE